ncbi:MAG: rhomboid family intramembrane serine protease [Thermocladium sp.]
MIGSRSFMNRWSTTVQLFIINSVISIPALVSPSISNLFTSLFAVYRPWFLVTNNPLVPNVLGVFMSMFYDPTFLDYFFNMLTLWFLGPFFESRFGARLFWEVYVVSGIVAALSVYIYPPLTAIAGASGALFGIVGFMIASPYRWAILSNPINIISIIFLLSPLAAGYGIAYLGHLLGFVVGLALGFYWSRRLVYRRTYRVRWGPY